MSVSLPHHDNPRNINNQSRKNPVKGVSSAISVDRSLTDYAPRVLFQGKRWGQWVLDAERLVLVFRGEPVPRGNGSGVTFGVEGYTAFLGMYEIDIEWIRQSSQVLDWIFQFNATRWATPEVMKDLLAAFRAIFHPQVNLCSFGSNKVIENPRAFLRSRIATGGSNAPLTGAA
jgi:hypothetical protein